MKRTHNRKLLVKPASNIEKLSNGIEVKQTITSRRQIVTGIIEQNDDKSIPLKKGDIVWFPKYAAESININGETFFLVQYGDIDLSDDLH